MQAISAKGAHLQSAAPAYMGSKYNTQEASITELLTDLESERAAKYGAKINTQVDSRRLPKTPRCPRRNR